MASTSNTTNNNRLGMVYKMAGFEIPRYMVVLTDPVRNMVSLLDLMSPIVGMHPVVRVENVHNISDKEWVQMTAYMSNPLKPLGTAFFCVIEPRV